MRNPCQSYLITHVQMDSCHVAIPEHSRQLGRTVLAEVRPVPVHRLSLNRSGISAQGFIYGPLCSSSKGSVKTEFGEAFTAGFRMFYIDLGSALHGLMCTLEWGENGGHSSSIFIREHCPTLCFL